MTTWTFIEQPTTPAGYANGDFYRDDECLVTNVSYHISHTAVDTLIQPGDVYVERNLSDSQATLNHDQWLVERERDRLFAAGLDEPPVILLNAEIEQMIANNQER